MKQDKTRQDETDETPRQKKLLGGPDSLRARGWRGTADAGASTRASLLARDSSTSLVLFAVNNNKNAARILSHEQSSYIAHRSANLLSSWVSVGKYSSSGALEVAMYSSSRRASFEYTEYSVRSLESIVCCKDL